MIEAPNHRKLLRLQKKLPDDLRQSSVVVAFSSAQSRSFCDEFFRIRLTQRMLGDSEQDFFQPEITQKSRSGAQNCTGCGVRMKRVDVNLWMCLNEYCPCKDVQGIKYHVIGPVRGVIDVETKFQAKHRGRMMAVDFFAGMENRTTYGYQYTIPVVSGCLLRLDRRYSEQVLTQVLRTAVGICEIYGVSVLN